MAGKNHLDVYVPDECRDHLVCVTFLMADMTGSPEESAEVLLDVYIPDECTVLSVRAWELVGA